MLASTILVGAIFGEGFVGTFAYCWAFRAFLRLPKKNAATIAAMRRRAPATAIPTIAPIDKPEEDVGKSVSVEAEPVEAELEEVALEDAEEVAVVPPITDVENGVGSSTVCTVAVTFFSPMADK